MTSSSYLAPKNAENRSIWLPSEVWVDAFKFLSRRDLLRNVQPACRRFHALADLHVHNVHVIHHFGRFVHRLRRNLPEAKKHYAELADNDASLAEHFRLGKYLNLCMKPHKKFDTARAERHHRAQMCILRHSLDLLQGCRLNLGLMSFPVGGGINLDQFLAYLALLRPLRPLDINVMHESSSSFCLQPDELLRERTILSCARLTFYQRHENSQSADSICNWLHHLPNEDDKKEQGHETRILKLEPRIMPSNTCAEIIERCKKLLRQTDSPFDRRSFLLIFHLDTHQQMTFRLDHPTGEVLYLEIFRRNDTPEGTYYHLRRCPIGDLTISDQFYRDNFKDDAFSFRTAVKNGIEAPILSIIHDV